MADKQQLRSTVKRIEKIKTWQLVILLLMAGFVAATFLRLNNVGMIERRAAVLVADEEGDDVQLEKRLYDLQRYVSEHMNTDPGRVPLEHKYARDTLKAADDFEDSMAQASGENVFGAVRAVCDPIGQAQGWRWPDPRYTECINQELEKYPEGEGGVIEFQPPSAAPYYHTFISPRWSPDFAGWSLVVCGVIALAIVVRLVTLGILKLLLMRQYRRT